MSMTSSSQSVSGRSSWDFPCFVENEEGNVGIGICPLPLALAAELEAEIRAIFLDGRYGFALLQGKSDWQCDD